MRCSRYACLLCGIAVAWVFQMILCCNGVSGTPHIKIDKLSWDFGTVTNGFLLEHDFCISNSGDAPLIVNRLISSCDLCLHPSIESTNIPPGEGTMVHALLDLRLLDGQVTRTVLVYCNDPQNPVSALDLNGDVISIYQIVPEQPILDLTQTNVVTTEISPSFPLHKPLSRAYCSNTNIEGHVSTAEDGGYILTIQARDSLPKQSFIVAMTVSSDDTNDPVCTLAVSVHSPPDLEFIPSQLVFQAQAEEQTQVLWLRQHGTSPLTLLDAVLPPDKFQCEIDPDQDGYDYAIYITAVNLQSGGSQTNTLVLKMRDASNHEKDTTVPISVVPAVSGLDQP
jgi:hypothetical protein